MPVLASTLTASPPEPYTTNFYASVNASPILIPVPEFVDGPGRFLLTMVATVFGLFLFLKYTFAALQYLMSIICLLIEMVWYLRSFHQSSNTNFELHDLPPRDDADGDLPEQMADPFVVVDAGES